jgi:2-phosphoglycerate kinase
MPAIVAAVTERDWTVLLIGGGPCTGKTALAQALSKHFDVPAIEGDLFRLVASDELYRQVDPELNVYFEPGFWQRPLEQLVEGARRLSQRMFQLSEAVIARQGRMSAPLIIEAVWVLPELAVKQTFSGYQMHGQVRSLYVYEPHANVLRQRLDVRPDTWWAGLVEEEKAPRAAMFHAKGLEVARNARALNLPLLECRPFDTLVDRALAALSSTP